ncbi:glycosyltransferase family 4 protein [Coralloluteibacterium thermophilus]|uniref:Glycosyltransferase family 4 protein n=1 Tax=Coralloluteibacterium thermophilum TaxID=2707049 RepID=A0ABV9NMA9_9GAMM
MRVQRVMMSADAVGGVWTYALELARGLAEEGVETLLAVLGPAPGPQQRAEASAIPGLRLRHGDFPLEWMHDAMPAQDAAGAWLLALARDFAPDVVHLNHYCHGHLDWPAPALVVAHSCVFSWHAHVRGRPPGPEWQAYRDGVTRGLRGAALVVAPTRAMLADAERHYGPFRAGRVVHNGRRAEDFPPRPKRALVLSAGRLWDEAKNVGALAVAGHSLPWPVHVAGEARHPEGGVAGFDGLHPLGRLDAARMAAAYGEAAIYALPARYEPFGLSALEAALAGCALVLGDIPSLRELWDGAATFVPPDDPDAIAAALHALVEDAPERERRAALARARAATYSSARTTAAYLDAYSRLIHANHEATACTS